MKNKKVPFGIAAKYASVSEDFVTCTLGMRNEYDAAINAISLNAAQSYMSGNPIAPEKTIIAYHLSDTNELVKTKLAAAQAVFDTLPEEKAKRARFLIDSTAGHKLFMENGTLTKIGEKARKYGVAEAFKTNMRLFAAPNDTAVTAILSEKCCIKEAKKQAKFNADFSMRMPIF